MVKKTVSGSALWGVVIVLATMAGCDRSLDHPLTSKPTQEQILAVRNRGSNVTPARIEFRDVPRGTSVRETAAEALSRIGDPAVPALVAALSDEDAAVRAQSARALARMGSKAGKAVPDLMVALKDDDRYVRICAARALGHIGPDAAEAIPALIEALREEPPEPPAPRRRLPRLLDDTY